MSRMRNSRLDPIEPCFYKPLPGKGRVPIPPRVAFDPDACDKYPILRYGDRALSGRGPVEITIFLTPDRHWVKRVGKYVVVYEPSGGSEKVYVESDKEVREQEAHRKLREAGFKVPSRPGTPRDTANREQHESKSEMGMSRLIRANATRNEWLYGQYVYHPEKTLTAIRSEAKQKGWNLSSDQAMHRAVKSHCDSLGIPMPTRKKPCIKQD